MFFIKYGDSSLDLDIRNTNKRTEIGISELWIVEDRLVLQFTIYRKGSYENRVVRFIFLLKLSRLITKPRKTATKPIREQISVHANIYTTSDVLIGIKCEYM